MILQNESLTEYIAKLQMSGRYTFTQEEALSALHISHDAFRLAAYRLAKKKFLLRPMQCFYVIVPTEYQGVGAPPITWYIDSLMQNRKLEYYLGLLSAAALHGAAHQQPQVFQVITTIPVRPILAGHTRLQFLVKNNILSLGYQLIKTPTGYMKVSTPEMTAFDLVRYIKSSGYLNNVATVLSELQEQFDLERFTQLLETNSLELPYLQRMGYLLELVGANENIIILLKNWVKQHSPRFMPLRPGKTYKGMLKNKDWHLYINEQVESDL